MRHVSGQPSPARVNDGSRGSSCGRTMQVSRTASRSQGGPQNVPRWLIGLRNTGEIAPGTRVLPGLLSVRDNKMSDFGHGCDVEYFTRRTPFE